MNRDQIIHELVAIDAQLRRMRRLSERINSDAEFRARLPELIARTAQGVNRVLSEIGKQEGWFAGVSGPESVKKIDAALLAAERGTRKA